MDHSLGRLVGGFSAPPNHEVAAPMSPEQVQVWLHGSMARDRPLYNQSITIRYHGELELSRLEDSFNALLARHAIWRTAFRADDGELVQVVQPELHVNLSLVDLTNLPSSEREAELSRRATEAALSPIDLTTPPLFRVEAFKLAEDDHRLNLTLHHIIADDYSLHHVLPAELAAIYALGADEVGAPNIRFNEYARDRAEQVDSDAVLAQLEFWRAHLSPLPVLELPTDRQRPAILGYDGADEPLLLSRPLTQALRVLARQQGVSLSDMLLASFKVLLHRYTGQDDLVVGGLIDGRSSPGLENLFGYFQRMVPLRTHPRPTQPFEDYVREVLEAVRQAAANSDIPFDRIVRDLQPRRDPSVHPLFQTMFSMQSLGLADPRWSATQMWARASTAKMDLVVELEETPDEVVGRIVFNTELFNAGTIQRMISHWLTLVAGAASNPKLTLAALPLLTSAERAQIDEWNQTSADIPAVSLPDWILAQTLQAPERIAVQFRDQSLTYRQLDVRATELAGRLQEVGAGPGSIVSLFIGRSLDMVPALLAVLKTGAAYLPLDPTAPAARLAMLLEDAEPVLILADADLAGELPDTPIPVLTLEEGPPASRPPRPFQTVSIAPDAAAYVLYTSGSTGKPKAVEVSHGAVVNLLKGLQRSPGYGLDDITIAATRITFDVSVGELYLPLVTGGRLVIVPQETIADQRSLAALIARSGATVMPATPTSFRALVEEGWQGSKTLRLFCCGEILTRELAERLIPVCSELWNIYGPTEATVYATIHLVTSGEGPVSIGRPLDNYTIHILDAQDQLAPIGVPGELHIGGASLAKGYRNREDLTRERFVTLPDIPGRLYRTGDVARFHLDGSIEYLGRRDDQVKVRGFRIELGEIETALQGCPGVSAAVVKPWPDAADGVSLTAYVVMRDEQEMQPSELRRRLREHLPDYMCPAHFVAMPELPMTSSGKVDRKLLPEHKSTVTKASWIAPQGLLEQRVAGIWQEVLKIPNVGALDNFFDLGGHSILLAKLMRRIEAEFGRRLSISEAFLAPDIRRMAALLAGAPLNASMGTADLQASGSRPPLFWLNGGALFWRLAEAMGTDQPFLGVMGDRHALLEQELELPDIAAEMIRAIRERQPEGPYHLGGWCASAVLAYEVAQQLVADGHDVGAVIMLDPPSAAETGRANKLSIALGKARFHWSQAMRRSGAERWTYMRDRLRRRVDRIRDALDTEEMGQQRRLGAALDRACARYAPTPYNGMVSVVLAKDRPDFGDPRRQWSHLVRGPFVGSEANGDHQSMLERPNVKALAALIASQLERAQAIAAHP